MRSFTPMPEAIEALPRDRRGYPVPWFVSWPIARRAADFVAVEPRMVVTAIKHRVCWVSGQKLGRTATFVLGPMCAVNRLSAEPPSLPECAEWSAMNCPFLSDPARGRASRPGHEHAPGLMVMDNPGVTLLWETAHWEALRVDGGILVGIGEPIRVQWVTRGRRATAAEARHAFDRSVGTLRQVALAEGGQAVHQLTRAINAARLLLPSEAA